MYALTDIAQEYVSACAPPSSPMFTDVQKNLAELRHLAESESVRTEVFKYDMRVIRTSSSDERICAAFLRRALDAEKAGDIAAARDAVEEARRLLPTYSEVYRISGMVESRHDAFRAASEYETAIDLDPKSNIARYTFTHFLIQALHDYQGALDQLQILQQVDPDEPALMGIKAVALTRLGRYNDAASIYETLLKSVAQRSRKWRVQTYDQAAECYRRWSEQDYRMKDFRAALNHLRSSLQIIERAFSEGDVDDRLRELALLVLDESMGAALAGNHADDVSTILLFAEALAPHFQGGIPRLHNWERFGEFLVRSDKDARRMRSLPYVGVRGRVEDRFGRSRLPEPTDAPELDGPRLAGVVKRLPAGLPYGFIQTPDGRDWFFHRKFMAIDGTWEQLSEGTPVSFDIGENAQGVCAVAVRISGP
jgi:LuxR family glucitol operon transcriptional activator